MALAPHHVIIKAYDPAWPDVFRQESEALAKIFSGPDVRIEHVGSTAVPGLGAKPIIDIMVGVESITLANEQIAALAELDYAYMPEFEDELPERRFFRKPKTGKHRFHLHCVATASDFFIDHIVFRDYLKGHDDVAAQYHQLKLELAERFADNRPAYQEAKVEFIEQVLQLAGQTLPVASERR